MNNRCLPKGLPFNSKNARKIIIIGAGAVGSRVAYMLAGMGVTGITVYDGDIVEKHDVCTNTYQSNDVGKLKTEALEVRILNDLKIKIQIVSEYFSGQVFSEAAMVIACVDTMSARQRIWNSVNVKTVLHSLYVDVRSSGNKAEVYTMMPCIESRYASSLPNAENASLSLCESSGDEFASGLAATFVSSVVLTFWQIGRVPYYKTDFVVTPAQVHACDCENRQVSKV